MRRAAACSLFAAIAFAALTTPGAAGASDSAEREGEPVTIFAAASLRGALDEVVETWTSAAGHGVRTVYAGSATLARQVEAGAPADVILLANTAWMDHLESMGGLSPGTRRQLLSNTLVVVADATMEAIGTVETPAHGAELAALIGESRVAMGLTQAVPAGIYGRAALDTLGLWGGLRGQVVETENVRAALALVARGETAFGIVYATDAPLEPDLAIVARFHERTHPPIRYPLAISRDGDTPAARALLAHLVAPDALALFARHGFVPLQ